MENSAKHSEILFIWDARMCNPNGDMSNDNAPRFDDADEKAIVSDVRVKRTIRDDLQYRKNHPIFINNEAILAEGLMAEKRFDQVKESYFKQQKTVEQKGKDDQKSKSKKDDLEAFLSCIDNRLFGGVAPKSDIQLVGTVQFSWTKSLNKTETILKAGTGAFATAGKDGEAKYTKTFRADNYLPYALFAMYGSINSLQADKAKTTEEDVNEMLDSLWFGTKLLNTRSKEGQKPRLLIRIIYKQDSKYFIGLLDELVEIQAEASEMIRSIKEAEIDFSRLIAAINRAKNFIESISIVYEESCKKYVDQLEQLQLDAEKISIEDEVEFASEKTTP